MDKPTYVRPTLLRHRSGHMNKLGAGTRQDVRDAIDGVPVAELVAAYGSPLFVYSERRMRQRTRDLREQTSRRWPRVQLAWSYKTCYLDAVCRVFHDEGSLAEVVSAMEYRKARRLGVPPDRIVYNGPHKTDDTLRDALAGGARVHLDSFDELARVEALAAALGIRPQVALRLNVDSASQPRWDRFGFHLDSGQAWDAVRRLIGGGRLELAGLHCHIGTFVLDPRSYSEVTAKIVAFANRLRREAGIAITYLDLGGGFASPARLKAQYLPSEQVLPSTSAYVEAITDALGALEAPLDRPPLLLLETGRALIDDAGTLITTVVATKRLADGRQGLVVDAGVNLLYTSTWYRHQLTLTREQPGAPEPTTVFGPLCMNIDVVADHRMLPPLDPGAHVLVHPVGAYNLTQSMQFIHLRPAVVLIGEDGRHACIRRAEELADLVGPEALAPWQEG